MALPPKNLREPRISADAASQIVRILDELVDAIVEKYTGIGRVYDPLAEKGRKQKPFLYALFPDLVLASEIERSISTRMGSVLQQIAREIARGVGLHAETERTIVGRLAPLVEGHINHLIRAGRASEVPPNPPNLPEEIRTIRSLSQGAMVDGQVKIDLFIADGDDEYYFDLKTPSPNSEQPRGMKSRLMRVRALRLPRGVEAFAVFPYNPLGTDAPYATGRAYLDYQNGEVLVGRRFWDMIAGPGTYRELMAIFGVVGAQRRADLQAVLEVSDA